MTTTDRIALVGPSAPYRGGIADHTMALARHLESAGLLSAYIAWDRQFPGQARVLGHRLSGSSDATDRRPEPARIRTDGGPASVPMRMLRWDRPSTWVRAGRLLARTCDRAVVVVSSPLQLPAVHALTTSFRGASRGRQRTVVLIVHNVLPHERHRFDRALQRGVMSLADVVIVYARAEADRARGLTTREVRQVVLPFHPPAGIDIVRRDQGMRLHDRIAMLGFVRPYKGLDLLLEALAASSTTTHLIVRGEFWEPVERYERMLRDLSIEDRVTLEPGYLEGSSISSTLRSVDALVLPYRSATASQLPRLAFAHGVPVISSDADGLVEQVRHDVDGLVFTAGDVGSLAAALTRLADGDTRLRLRRAASPPDVELEWSEYLAALL
jgi:glycosyltransferase involved in cell wall biosynthesis